MTSLSRFGRAASSLLQCLERKTSLRSATSATRAFHSSPRTSQEKGKDDEGNLSFRGQLYQSTAERLKRERASEADYIRAQAKGIGRGNPASQTLGLSFSISCSPRFRPLANSEKSFCLSQARLITLERRETDRSRCSQPLRSREHSLLSTIHENPTCKRLGSISPRSLERTMSRQCLTISKPTPDQNGPLILPSRRKYPLRSYTLQPPKKYPRS